MKNLLKIVFFLPVLVSCTKSLETPGGNFTFSGGVLIVNEGNFRSGNGSLSFYSYDSAKIHNDLFYKVNGRPLGDIPNSITVNGDNAYIIVNNSGKIEVVNHSTLESKATINGLISPRYLAVINNSKAYVSSLYSDSVIVINLTSNKITGYINLRRTSEAIKVVGNKAYISNWTGGKEIMVVNTVTNELIDSIEVGSEPESMVLDHSGKLWVLCNGGWMRQNFAELDVINTTNNNVERSFVFPSKEASPSCLRIDDSGMIIYYLDKGVRQMYINAQSLPAVPIIPESGSYFYKIGICPLNGYIFVTDAVDYVQPGWVHIFNDSGEFVSESRTDVNPGEMCFI